MNGEGVGRLVWSIVKYLLIAYIVTTLILAGLAFALWKMSPPHTVISAGMIFAYVISSFVGGVLLGKRMNKNKYLWGIVFGALYFAILFVLAFALNKVSGDPSTNTVTVCLLCIGGGMLGGMLG